MEKIKANAIIEIAGAPEQHVKGTMNKVENLIEENKDFETIKKDIGEPQEQEFPSPGNPEKKVNIWSTIGEFEIDFKNFDALTNFCFEFMPSSIDILEPAEIKIGGKEINNTMNDILARLHHQARIIMEYNALKKRIEMAAKAKKDSVEKN